MRISSGWRVAACEFMVSLADASLRHSVENVNSEGLCWFCEKRAFAFRW